MDDPGWRAITDGERRGVTAMRRMWLVLALLPTLIMLVFGVSAPGVPPEGLDRAAPVFGTLATILIVALGPRPLPPDQPLRRTYERYMRRLVGQLLVLTLGARGLGLWWSLGAGHAAVASAWFLALLIFSAPSVLQVRLSMAKGALLLDALDRGRPPFPDKTQTWPPGPPQSW